MTVPFRPYDERFALLSQASRRFEVDALKRSMLMANIEVVKVEDQLNGRGLYSVRVNADRDHMEFPIGIQDRGSATANKAAVLTSTLAFVEELAAAARLQLGAVTRR
jgi:hypothetical protein